MIPTTTSDRRTRLRGLPALICAVLLASCMTSPGRRPLNEVKTGATTLRVFAAGDIADCRHRAPEQAPAHFTAALIPPGATVLALGDIAYESATSAMLQGCFEPTWGSHKTSTLLVAGNHDYVGGSTQ